VIMNCASFKPTDNVTKLHCVEKTAPMMGVLRLRRVGHISQAFFDL